MTSATAQLFCEVDPTDFCFSLEGKQERMLRDPSSVRELERETLVRT